MTKAAHDEEVRPYGVLSDLFPFDPLDGVHATLPVGRAPDRGPHRPSAGSAA